MNPEDSINVGDRVRYHTVGLPNSLGTVMAVDERYAWVKWDNGTRVTVEVRELRKPPRIKRFEVIFEDSTYPYAPKLEHVQTAVARYMGVAGNDDQGGRKITVKEIGA